MGKDYRSKAANGLTLEKVAQVKRVMNAGTRPACDHQRPNRCAVCAPNLDGLSSSEVARALFNAVEAMRDGAQRREQARADDGHPQGE
jgi:hypothetical protein